MRVKFSSHSTCSPHSSHSNNQLSPHSPFHLSSSLTGWETSNPISGHSIHEGNSPMKPAEPSNHSGKPVHTCFTPHQLSCCHEPRTTPKKHSRLLFCTAMEKCNLSPVSFFCWIHLHVTQWEWDKDKFIDEVPFVVWYPLSHHRTEVLNPSNYQQ